MHTARDLFLNELANLRDGEQKPVDPREQAVCAANPSLQRAFAAQLAQAEKQGERLQQAYTQLGEQPKAMQCISLKDVLEDLEKFKCKEDPATDVIAMLVLHSTWRAMSR